jgi:hypothetical protein
MCDVMLAVGEAGRANIRPTRIQLQKFIYLSDVVGQVVGLLKLTQAHKTYKAGPYDPAIQNAVDSLAFRELVRIAGVWRTPNGKLGTSYAISIAGRHFLKRLEGSDALSSKVLITRLVGNEVSRLGWARIVDLVYAEPTFVANRSAGYGVELDAENGLNLSSAFVFAIARSVIQALDPEKMVSPEWLANRFFAYLNDYDLNYGRNGVTASEK